MQFKKFKYYLTNAAGLFFAVIGSAVSLTPTETELPNAPDGWKDQAIGFARNTTYSNVFRSFTIPLRFVIAGAFILRTRLYTYGIEDITNLVIKRLNTVTGAYDLFYSGEIDYSKYSDTLQYFDANCMEGGIMKFLKAYENTDYEIPLSGDGTVYVEMDGLDLQKKITFTTVDGSLNVGDMTVGMAFSTEEGTSFGVITGNSPLQNTDGFDQSTNDDRWILKCIQGPVTFTITGTINIEVHTVTTPFRLYVVKNNGTQVDLVPTTGTLSIGTHSFNINASVTLSTDERLFIKAAKNDEFGHGDRTIEFFNDNLYFSFVSHFATSYIKARNAKNVAQDLLTKICGEGYTLDSDLLEYCGIYLTSGDGIRGLDGAVIKTSWKKFFASFNRNLNIGMSVSGTTATIDTKQSFFSTALIYALGKVKDAKFSFAEDYMFNTVKVGYPNQDYDDVNGRDEFNNTHQYTGPITRISKELDLTGDYRADAYGIELVRINLENKVTVDSGSDNDTFMLDVLSAGTTHSGLPLFNLNRPAFTSITGVLNPTTIFNVRLSPKRCLLAHGATIRSGFWKFDTSSLIFQTTEKNDSLSTTLGGQTITENANVSIASLSAPYYIPVKVDFETQVPDALSSLMETYGNGKFTFEYNGSTYEGYCLEAKQKPSGNESQQWTLLLTANNNMEGLIHG